MKNCNVMGLNKFVFSLDTCWLITDYLTLFSKGKEIVFHKTMLTIYIRNVLTTMLKYKWNLTIDIINYVSISL